MNVSIVIPVYNEALELDACLQAIARQNIAPFEVIVVDNNSTDNTREIARRYDFVTLLSEAKQGVVHARTAGFDAAQGDVLARIDADTIVPADWVRQLQEVFADTQIDAVSGVARYYNMSAAGLFTAGDVRLRRYLARKLKGSLYLWGANMALRHSAWAGVRKELCFRGGIHEDYDIGLHLQQHGYSVHFCEDLVVAVSSRRIDVGYGEFMRYTLASPRTYAVHHAGHQRTWYLVVAAAAITYLPAHILHRGYDRRQKRFTLKQLLAHRTVAPRANPTSNVT